MDLQNRKYSVFGTVTVVSLQRVRVTLTLTLPSQFHLLSNLRIDWLLSVGQIRTL